MHLMPEFLDAASGGPARWANRFPGEPFSLEYPDCSGANLFNCLAQIATTRSKRSVRCCRGIEWTAASDLVMVNRWLIGPVQGGQPSSCIR